VDESPSESAERPGADARALLGAEPGLCWTCRHSKVNQTRKGTAYLRCTRAEWDDRLRRYPPLPVMSCVGYEARQAD
jgi:propionyl-CoA synthetase